MRPFGCRVFFCDSTSDAWQHERSERLHSELKRLHETMGVPYFYVEWRLALRALGLTQKGLRKPTDGDPSPLATLALPKFDFDNPSPHGLR